MKNAKLKMVTCFLALVMIVSLMPAITLNADSTNTWGYNSTTKTLTVSYKGAIPSATFMMPGSKNNAPWGKYAKEAETLVISNGTTSIGNGAFGAFTNLTTVVWPTDGKLKTIGNSAFAWTSLEVISIPKGVTTIGASAFEYVYCSKIVLPNTLKTIGKAAFANDNDSRIKSISIPSSVTSIGQYAFYGNPSLTSVTSGAGLVTIGSYAFYGCSKLTTFKCTSSKLKTIGTNAFKSCKKLKTIYIQKTTKLTKKTVKNSLKNSSITTVKVKKTKVKTYKKYFTKSNCGRKVTVKK